MDIASKFKALIEILRVANDDVIGNTARELLNLKWSEGLSSRNQAHKVLDILAATGQIAKAKGFYAVKEYQGEFKEHDRLVTDCIARLILLKLPITVRREVSFPIGVRSDIVALIGKNGKAACAIIEVANHETENYLSSKVAAWKNWHGANEALGQLFSIPIPHYSLVVCGKSHPEALDFETFLKEVQ